MRVDIENKKNKKNSLVQCAINHESKHNREDAPRRRQSLLHPPRRRRFPQRRKSSRQSAPEPRPKKWNEFNSTSWSATTSKPSKPSTTSADSAMMLRPLGGSPS